MNKAGRDGHTTRHAEMPVREPHYDMQHLEMEHEYGDMSAGGHVSGSPRQISPQQPEYIINSHQPFANYPPSQTLQYGQTNEWGYTGPSENSQIYIANNQHNMQQYYPSSSTSNGLPPGAMRPAVVEHSWASGYSRSASQDPPHSAPPYNRGYSRSTSPSPPDRSRSPSSDSENGHRKLSSRPSTERNKTSPTSYSRSVSLGGSQPASERSPPTSSGRLSGRSLSATAVMTNTSNHYTIGQDNVSHRPGKLKKRPSAGSSSTSRSSPPQVHTQVYDGLDEEEDMPLAIWQEQQQRSRRR